MTSPVTVVDHLTELERSVPVDVTRLFSSHFKLVPELIGVESEGATYAAIVHFKGQSLSHGGFPNVLEAAKFRDKTNIVLFGEQAETNFPAKSYQAERFFTALSILCRHQTLSSSQPI